MNVNANSKLEDEFGFVNLKDMLEGNKLCVDLCDMVLLDNQLMTDIFCNPRLVKKIWETKDFMMVHSNGRF